MLFKKRDSTTSLDRQLVGAMIDTYLLEKSRVVRQDQGERNYHAFFYVCRQASSHPEWEMGDGNPKNFHYLNQSACTTIDGDASTDAEEFTVLVNAMNTLRFPKEQQV